jgi:hypothetical protein
MARTRRIAHLSVLPGCPAVALWATIGGADNSVRWTVHVDGSGASSAAVALPASLFKDHALPVRGARWHCLADKVLRQDASGNTYSTLTVHCFDGETTVSSSASCLIGNHAADRLSLQLLEKTTSVQNELRADCEG